MKWDKTIQINEKTIRIIAHIIQERRINGDTKLVIEAFEESKISCILRKEVSIGAIIPSKDEPNFINHKVVKVALIAFENEIKEKLESEEKTDELNILFNSIGYTKI